MARSPDVLVFSRLHRLAGVLLVVMAAACASEPVASVDAATDASPDAGPITPRSTEHCTYEPLPATARAGGTVASGEIRVGLAELPLDIPVGVALGGNTSRAVPLDNQGWVDERDVPLSGFFTPSVGIETIPMVKAIALSAGDETIVILRTDTIFGDDSITAEVSERLGPELAGKVLWTSSHTHTGPAQYSADEKLQVGAGRTSASVRAQLVDRMVQAAEAALAAREPARIGFATDEDFDPEDRVSYDRRPENDDLFGGEERKDRRLLVIRIDRLDGTPLAILPLFGVHSAILDDDVAVFSTDASGAFERAIEEEFDHEVMVVHLQGAGGDVLGSSHEHLAFPDGEPLWDFARNEECARAALPEIMAAWEAAGASMSDELAMEMVTRSVPLGPDWRTFSVRDGALEYAPWDGRRMPDRIVFDAAGGIASPIDEFNAPNGAGLCGSIDLPLIPRSGLVGTAGLAPYSTCARMEMATNLLGPLLDVDFHGIPICAGTRTTIGALRLGDYLFGLAPGEPLVLFRDELAERSPYPVERTFVIGYALGHQGYLLTPEDWMRGGFEPTINVWGPLEGEHVLEEIDALFDLAVSDAREDAGGTGSDRVVPILPFDIAPAPDPAPLAGTVPASVPADVYFRLHAHPATAQPEPTIPRVTGVARFVWIGEDPMSGTPRVALEREDAAGTFVPVVRGSGRPVTDLDLIVVWTPLPLALGTEPRTHYWTVEWQAVAPFGTADLEDRAGLPLGRYRFHVEGTGYVLDSDPFEVVAGPIEVTARVEGADVVVSARYQPRDGWRLLREDGLSNRDVALSAGPLDIEVTREGGSAETLTTPAGAEVRITPAAGARIVRVRVRDRFGNEGAADL